MNFLIDEFQNKLILQVFDEVERSLEYSTKLGKKTEEQLMNEFFGTDTQPKLNNKKIHNKNSQQRHNCHEEDSPQEYERIFRPNQSSSLIKLQPQKPSSSDLLKNSKTLSNIHLRHLVHSYLKSQCKKIESLKSNYSCDEVKGLARNLILNFFLRYTLIFQELQAIGGSELIEKQLRKSICANYIEILCLLYKKGFRTFISLMKMLANLWLISNFITYETFSYIKREIKHLLGMNIEFLLPDNDKLTYQLAFKLRKMATPADFSYEKQKKRKKQQRQQRRKEKLKKKVLTQFQAYQKNKIAIKNIKLQSGLSALNPKQQNHKHQEIKSIKLQQSQRSQKNFQESQNGLGQIKFLKSIKEMNPQVYQQASKLTQAGIKRIKQALLSKKLGNKHEKKYQQENNAKPTPIKTQGFQSTKIIDLQED